MRTKKRYNKIRLGDLKKLSQNYEREKKASRYAKDKVGGMPIMEGHHRGDSWVEWLREKIELQEI